MTLRFSFLLNEVTPLEIARLKIWRSHRRESKKSRDAFGGSRPAEQIALPFIASMIPKKCFLFYRFAPLRHARQPQSLDPSNGGIRNRLVVAIIRKVTDE